VVVWLLLMVAATALMLRLLTLQVLDSKELQAKALEQQEIKLNPFLARRTIVDRDGRVVAIDREIYSLWAYPSLIQDNLEATYISEQLAPLLRQPRPDWQEKLRGKEGFRIEQWLTPSEADRLAAKLRTMDPQKWRSGSVELVVERQRNYPQKELFAAVSGFVNADHLGQNGVESSYEFLIKPRPSEAVDRAKKDGRGLLLPNTVPKGVVMVDQNKVQLTLSARLQRSARKALQEQMKEYNASQGIVLVMDTRNGEMLAMVKEPTYDPNTFFSYKQAERDRLFRNAAITDLFEPGSTFKPINVAIALEAGAIQPDTVIYDEGTLDLGGGHVVENFDLSGGNLSIQQIIERSSNVGMIHIVERLKPQVYYNWLEQIGLGDRTGIDLPGEQRGILKTFEELTLSRSDTATVAFGNGVSLTPIQLLQLHGALANDGKLVTPHVVRGLITETGEDIPVLEPRSTRQIFSAAIARQVMEMMVSVVEGGTGKNARIPGYRLAGKTGTAEQPNLSKVTSFVGIFPARQPRYVTLAVIYEPDGDNAFGGTVAAPLVKSVIEELIVMDGVAPSHREEVVPSPPAEPERPPATDP
jgi:cell division protein FtsI (penicillin-binding protein 3)